MFVNCETESFILRVYIIRAVSKGNVKRMNSLHFVFNLLIYIYIRHSEHNYIVEFEQSLLISIWTLAADVSLINAGELIN